MIYEVHCAGEQLKYFRLNKQNDILGISRQVIINTEAETPSQQQQACYQSGALQSSEIMMLPRQLSHASSGHYFLPFAGSVCHKSVYNWSFPYNLEQWESSTLLVTVSPQSLTVSVVVVRYYWSTQAGFLTDHSDNISFYDDFYIWGERAGQATECSY